MKLKLDENFGSRTKQLLVSAGHDVETVSDELLNGTSDQNLYKVCCNEQRCLITFDKDFADVISFPPQQTKGIVVIRLPRNPSLQLLENLILQFLRALKQMPVEKQLWIVEVNRIRVHQSDESDV